MILSAMIQALAGRRLWMKTKRKYGVGKSGVYVIMLPDADRELNELALRHIDDFLSYRKAGSAVILTTDGWVAKHAREFSKRIAAVELISMRDCRYYRRYYYYYSFSAQFIMISLQGSYGERLALADQVNGIDKEDLACLGLYIIRNWTKAEMRNG